MPTFRILVTQDDITQGAAGLCASCPVARAIRRETRCTAEVFHTYVRLYARSMSGPYATIQLPAEAQQFVATFDRRCDRRRMPAFDFTLAVPADLMANRF